MAASVFRFQVRQNVSAGTRRRTDATLKELLVKNHPCQTFCSEEHWSLLWFLAQHGRNLGNFASFVLCRAMVAAVTFQPRAAITCFPHPRLRSRSESSKIIYTSQGFTNI